MHDLYTSKKHELDEILKKDNASEMIDDLTKLELELVDVNATNNKAEIDNLIEVVVKKRDILKDAVRISPSVDVNSLNLQKITGLSSSNIDSSANYADNVVLSGSRGHGFAAEKANHLKDVFQGKDAKIVGGDNAKNGADRLVDGQYIQTKYCNSGSKCISECFENGEFRYVNQDGTLMQIEVPSDMYESAVKAMENRIEKGQVPGISDPKEARNLIKKGGFTYEQAKNIAKAGTVESITYDAANGIVLSAKAMGITAAISFALSLWNGKDARESMEIACYEGIKVGGAAFISSIMIAQVGRTGIEQGLRATTDWMVKQLGPKASAWLVNGLRGGNSSIFGASAMSNLSKLLRGNIVGVVVITLTVSSFDAVNLFRGRCSGKQFLKGLAINAAGVAGGTGGAVYGAAAGSAVLPGVGTFIGALVGGVAASIAASKVAKSGLDSIIEDDAKKMLEITEKVFGKLAPDYLLTQDEVNKILDAFKNSDVSKTFADMHASKNRGAFIEKVWVELIHNQVKKREKIELPSDAELKNELIHMIKLAEERAAEIKRETILRVFESYSADDIKRLYTPLNMNTKKITHFLDKIDVQLSETPKPTLDDILIYIDETFFGKGDIGMALTKQGLLLCNSGCNYAIDIQYIDKIEVSDSSKKAMTVYFNDEKYASRSSRTAKGVEYVLKIIKEYYNGQVFL